MQLRSPMWDCDSSVYTLRWCVSVWRQRLLLLLTVNQSVVEWRWVYWRCDDETSRCSFCGQWRAGSLFSLSARNCITVTPAAGTTKIVLCISSRPPYPKKQTSSNSSTVLHRVSKMYHLWLAITLTHVNGFWYFFRRNVTDKSNQKRFTVPPQITSASAVPAKRENT